MEVLSVAFKNELNNAKEFLEYEIKDLEKEFNIIMNNLNIDDTCFYYFSFDKSNDNKDNIVNKISDIIATIIINHIQRKIVDRKINSICFYLNKNEKKKIKEKAYNILDESNYFVEKNMYHESDKHKVFKCLIDYFKENNLVILEGFVDFRLSFLSNKVESIVDKLLTEYLLEQEYNEFVKILQYFIEIQEPKIEVVNVIIKKNGRYLLYDKNKKLINNEFLDEIIDEMSENEMNYNDLLISSLITIAPKEIFLHIDETLINNDVIQIIKNVFVDRVKICTGCEFCTVNKELKNKIKH